MDKRKASILIVVVGVIIAGIILFLEFSPQFMMNLRSNSGVADRTVSYINSNLLQPGQTATLESYSIESGLIKMIINIDGQPYDSYVTRDGKLLFPISAVQIEDDFASNDQVGVPDGQMATNLVIDENSHIRGDVSAQVTLVEFSDFECPFCANFAPILKRILSEYEGQVRLVYKHFPLRNIHTNAQKAAEASECAGEQGKFWEYHDILFENQSSGLNIERFKNWAVELGLNASQFNDCLDSSKYEDKVQADLSEGLSNGISGTPATFVNGELLSGVISFEILKDKIDNLLEN